MKRVVKKNRRDTWYYEYNVNLDTYDLYSVNHGYMGRMGVTSMYSDTPGKMIQKRRNTIRKIVSALNAREPKIK